MDNTHWLALPAEPPSVQKKETNRNFLLFRSLPKEVRLLIWEAAVRPQPSTNYNATHVFRINASGGDDLSSPEASDVGRQSPPLLGSRNTREPDDHKMCEPVSRFPEELKSVTHWDYGLWNACDESRWVISRRFRHKYWEEMKKSVLKDLQIIPQEIVPYTMEFAWLTTNRLMENGCPEDGKWYKDFASVFSIDATHNNIIATHPARDLFLVEDERWMDQMARQPTDSELEDNAVHFLRDNVISPTGDGFPILGHIGFMFDDSWTDHLSRTANPRMSLTEAKTKNNPRGLFLLLLHLMVVRVIGGLRLWLIDEKFEPCHTCKTKSDAEGEVEEEKRNRKVFYRYGKEDLVEVDVKPNVMRVITDNTSCIIGTSCGILEFVSLDPISRYPAFNPDPRATHIDIWSCVGVLAPRSRTPY